MTRRCRYCDTVIPAHRRRRLYCHKGCRYAWHDLARTRRSA